MSSPKQQNEKAEAPIEPSFAYSTYRNSRDGQGQRVTKAHSKFIDTFTMHLTVLITI